MDVAAANSKGRYQMRKYLKQEKRKPVPLAMGAYEFSSWEERDKRIIATADYFTVGRRLGPRRGYERYEERCLSDALNLARRMANSTKKVYMIYAVAGISDCFVTAIHPEA